MNITPASRMNFQGGNFLSSQQEMIRDLLRQGKEVINLGRGNPDQPTFNSVLQHFSSDYLNRENHGYPPYGGKVSLKEAVILFYKNEYGVDLKPTEVTILNGSLSALTALPMILVENQDIVLTPDPSFFGYDTGVRMAGGISYKVPLTEENNYLPRLEDIPKDILENAKLLFLNYPHNPTGAGASIDFFEKVVEFAEDNDIVIAHDFAYGDISFDKKAPSFLQASEAKKVGIEIYTLSKTFNMAGWRIAFAVGNEQVIGLLEKYIRGSVGGTFGAIQDAVTYGLQYSSNERNELRNLYLSRKNDVENLLATTELSYTSPKGTFFIWVKIPEVWALNDVEFANKLLLNKGVAVVAGSSFGEYGKGFIRISLVAPNTVLIEGVKKMITFINENEGK